MFFFQCNKYRINLTHSSIHYLPFLTGVSREAQTSFLPATYSDSSRGVQKCPQASWESLQGVLDRSQGLLLVAHTRKTSGGRPSGGTLTRIPSHLIWLLSSDDRASHPISKGELKNPAEETHFSHFYPGSCSFSLMTHSS